jgi:hypothetical protein
MPESPNRRLKTKVGWIFIIIALLLLLGLYYWTFPDLIQWVTIERQSVQTKGTVIEAKILEGGDGVPGGMRITYRFEISNADTTLRSYTNSQNTKKGYAVNAEVPIEYAASNPAYSRIEGEDPELWVRLFLTAFLIPLAAVILYSGILSIKSARKQQGEQSVAPSCPYCGAQLRTKFAKQCPQCNRDWHEEMVNSLPNG